MKSKSRTPQAADLMSLLPDLIGKIERLAERVEDLTQVVDPEYAIDIDVDTLLCSSCEAEIDTEHEPLIHLPGDALLCECCFRQRQLKVVC